MQCNDKAGQRYERTNLFCSLRLRLRLRLRSFVRVLVDCPCPCRFASLTDSTLRTKTAPLYFGSDSFVLVLGDGWTVSFPFVLGVLLFRTTLCVATHPCNTTRTPHHTTPHTQYIQCTTQTITSGTLESSKRLPRPCFRASRDSRETNSSSSTRSRRTSCGSSRRG